MSTGFIYGDLLSEDYYIVSYVSNSGDMMDGTRKQIQNSAVRISAAITASARIYMYPFLSGEDCYYTDTDSVILGNKLPEEHISNSVLGLFKLKYQIAKGYFLAPKSYCLVQEEMKDDILVHQGAGKSLATREWFEEQYKDMTSKAQMN
jgi:hypothetical protein